MPSIQGLSSSEAAARRARGEGNTVSFGHTRSYAQIVRENVFTFINNVLYVLGIALILLGRVSDAVVSVGVVSVNILVSVVQEVRAKRTLDRISLLTRPQAIVVRDGQEKTVDPSDVVLGDALRVNPGDQIVVDGVVLDGRIDVDESLLTGESDLVAKKPGDEVFSGSFCVTGTAYYEAKRVGAQSMANQITAGARAFRRVLTPLQREVNLVIRVLILVVAYFQILLMISAYVNGITLVDSVRMSVVLAGLVPNGLFLAIAVAYSLGAVRIARQGALVQQANAIESLSNVDVLCMDKTGTLTANRIALESAHPLGGVAEADLRLLLADYAASTAGGNKTNEALAAAGAGRARPVDKEVPFSSARKWSALAYADGGAYVLGAPEMIREHFAPGGDDWTAIAADGTEQGLRVLLFARVPDGASVVDGSGEPQLPDGLQPLGIIRFSDELRPEARETLAKFRQTGVQLKIISGDNPQTVRALARQAGFDAGTRMISGPEMDALDDAQFAQAAEDAMVFGRVTPQHKERLVQALKKRGHYVAMIGDGVNDVLSLKQSNLGIAMQSGSQATRSVADIILLNDSFGSLPAALLEGQRIINGMQDILKIFLTRILYVSLLFISTGLVGGFPFGPKESSLLALVTVGIPTVALAIWARPGMRRSRNRNLMRSLVHFVIPAAATISLAALGVYVAILVNAYTGLADVSDQAAWDYAQRVGQTALTTVSVLCGLALLVFVEPPTLLWTGGDEYSGDWRPTILAGVMLAGYLAVLFTPLREQFELAPLGWQDMALIAVVALVWVALVRWAWRHLWLERFLSAEAM